MSFFSRLFGRDPREAQRSLWHRVVEVARERHWFADEGVEDSVAGRFDMITTVLAMVLLRLEKEPECAQACVFLTEFFVDDMDAQLRESGVGDQVVGKHIGRQIAVLGGRLGALREAVAQDGTAALEDYARRNMTMLPDAPLAALAQALRALEARIAATATDSLLKGDLQ
jgi:cytochrome b pre-mRNA-processing protein 3